MSVTVKLSKTAQEIMLASYHIQKDFQLTLFLEKKTKKQKTKPNTNSRQEESPEFLIVITRQKITPPESKHSGNVIPSHTSLYSTILFPTSLTQYLRALIQVPRAYIGEISTRREENTSQKSASNR